MQVGLGLSQEAVRGLLQDKSNIMRLTEHLIIDFCIGNVLRYTAHRPMRDRQATNGMALAVVLSCEIVNSPSIKSL